MLAFVFELNRCEKVARLGTAAALSAFNSTVSSVETGNSGLMSLIDDDELGEQCLRPAE